MFFVSQRKLMAVRVYGRHTYTTTTQFEHLFVNPSMWHDNSTSKTFLHCYVVSKSASRSDTFDCTGMVSFQFPLVHRLFCFATHRVHTAGPRANGRVRTAEAANAKKNVIHVAVCTGKCSPQRRSFPKTWHMMLPHTEVQSHFGLDVTVGHFCFNITRTCGVQPQQSLFICLHIHWLSARMCVLAHHSCTTVGTNWGNQPTWLIQFLRNGWVLQKYADDTSQGW